MDAACTSLVIGLGNPGPRYATHRHNVGHMVVDQLAARAGLVFRSHRSRAAVAEGRLTSHDQRVPGPRVVLAKPLTYMNLAGGPVAALASFFKVAPADLIIVHDELDIPFGVLRLKRGGGEGGHNGLRDVTKAVGTRDYVRVRVGIGRPPGRMDPADFVLRDFSRQERNELPVLLDEAADAVELTVVRGLEGAQLEVHTRS